MTTTVSARRYAQAIFQIAQEKNELDKWRDELGKMTGILKLPELIDLLEAAKVPFAQKPKHNLLRVRVEFDDALTGRRIVGEKDVTARL